VRIVSRTREHAAALARRVNGKTLAFEELEKALAAADIVISSTAAPHVIITREMAQQAMRGRDARPLFLIDIALPRDIDPAAASVPNVHVHDIDGLQRHVESNLAERESEIPSVERIVNDETLACVSALEQLGIAPLITDLRTHADEIRKRALSTALKTLAHLSEKDQRRIEAFSEALLNKLLHEPTTRLRTEAGTGGRRAAEYASTVRDLFGLTPSQAAS
jgi:glutamyl-tRNA reductase